jgi:hypothetical protein
MGATLKYTALATVGVSLALAGSAFAADLAVKARPAPAIVPVVSAWEFELGARYFGSTGQTQYDLYRIPPTSLISRLTYRDIVGHAGEAFGRFDHSSGIFIKGFGGVGGIGDGTLQDEDFPPGIPGGVYSSTNSIVRNGHFGYGSVDLGYAFWNTGAAKVGAYVGYFHYSERVDAFGCTQTAGNPAICVPTIPTTVRVLREDTNWDAMKVGLNAVWRLTDRVKLTVDGAWIPYARLDARDTHFLRIGPNPGDFNGPTRQDGDGWGVMLEGKLQYALTQNWSIGIGGRYWRIETDPRGATTHFEQSVVGGGGAPQATTFRTERVGGFIEASYTFGAPPVVASY